MGHSQGRCRSALLAVGLSVLFSAGAASTAGANERQTPATADSSRAPLVFRIRAFQENESERRDPTKEYKYQLLQLILDRTTGSDGPYRIEVVEHIPQSRVIEMVNQGKITGIITMTSGEREQKLRTIRIPTHRGLYGYRLLIIRKQDRARFGEIETVDDLKELWAGQGYDWPDRSILRANGFKTVGAMRMDGLFGMLVEGRIDYLALGAHEVWKQLEEHGLADRLMVEPHLALYYPAPAYLFIRKDDEQLAGRLQRGFRAALADGSFLGFFQGHPEIARALEMARLDERLVFRLENPLLTPETPLDRPELWYAPEPVR